jgi:DNA-binding NarL/FixJ family response regulator
MKFLHVDDHALFRDGFSLLIDHAFPGFAMRQASSLAQALQILRDQPDIKLVLLDLELPDSRGVATLQRLREAMPGVIAVVLSADERRETILAAIDAGASGFIPKTVQAGAMREALQKVLRGGIYLPPSMLAMNGPPAVRSADSAKASPLASMSPRQADVLRLLLEGKPNKRISRELEMSESTVKTHLVSIFRKLSVATRTEAIVTAARLGWHTQDLSRQATGEDSRSPESA